MPNIFWGTNCKIKIGNGPWEDLKVCDQKKFAVGDKVHINDGSHVYVVKCVDGDRAWIKGINDDTRMTCYINELNLVPKLFAEVDFYDQRPFLYVAGKPIVGTCNSKPNSLINYTKQDLEALASIINAKHKENHMS